MMPAAYFDFGPDPAGLFVLELHLSGSR